MSKYVLGIDIGTGSCKCCVITTEGEIICSYSSEYDVNAAESGSVTQNPKVWYKAFIDTLKKIKVNLEDITAVGTTGQMRGLTFIGKDKEVVADSVLWNDTRCVDEAEMLNRKEYGSIKEITYNPINTMCTLPKILWTMKHEAKIWNDTYKFIYPKDYINFALTGEIATDHSDASGSSVYDFKSKTWSKKIIADFSLGKEKFPEILNSFEIIGNINEKAAEKTGLKEGIPVVAGGSDATTELFSIGVVNGKQCKIRLGSSCGISTVVEEKSYSTAMEHYCWKPVTGEGIVLDINTRFCAQSVRWLRDVFYNKMPKTGETYQLIDREAKSVKPGTDGLIFHPYLQGEDAPYWDMALRGMFSGINAGHQRRHFARAVFEGVAFSIKDVITTYPEIYDKCEEYKVIGGGTKSETWLKIIIDVLGKDVILPKKGDAAFGACLIALIGTADTDIQDLIEDIVEKDNNVLKPNFQNTEFYNEQFSRYKELTDKILRS